MDERNIWEIPREERIAATFDRKQALCAGYRTSGYWKGSPCGAQPMHTKNGFWWCKNHMPLEPSDPLSVLELPVN